MNNTSLLNLPEFPLCQILDFLDEKAVCRMSTTCSFFKKLKEKNSFFSKAAKFILENYDIVAASTLSNLKRIFFAPIRFILVGEHHAYDNHRWLNAKMIESLWNENSKLFVEGEKQTLEYWKKEETGQVKHLKKEIAKTAENWDDINSSFLELLSEVTEFARLFARLSKDCFNLLSDLNKWTYDHLLSFIEQYFDKDLQEKIYQKIPEIKELKNKENKHQIYDEKRKIIRKVLDVILFVFSNKSTAYTNKIYSFSAVRNASLKNKSIMTLLKDQKSGIFVSGIIHVYDVLAEINDFCRLNQFPFLVLNPKEEKIEPKNPEKVPSVPQHEWSKRNSELEKLQAIFARGNVFTFIHEIANAVDLKYLKDLVLNIDVQKIGESDENHFGIWIQLCLSLLTLESIKLEIESISLEKDNHE